MRVDPCGVCYFLLGVGFLVVLCARAGRCVVFGEVIGVERDRVARVERRVDPNTAGWAELARLPGVGEALAKRIVAYRDARRAAVASGPGSVVVFHSLQDLGAIRGIGPKRLAGFAGHLRWPSVGPAGAD